MCTTLYAYIVVIDEYAVDFIYYYSDIMWVV